MNAPLNHLRWWLLAICTALAACAGPTTRVVLLPQANGQPSSVIVTTTGGSQILAQPYARATATPGAAGAPALDQADPEQLRRDNAELFAMVPPPPEKHTLYFDAGGTVLTGESQAALTRLFDAALTRSGADIVVTGHTDTTGNTEQNDALSLRRAQEVKQMLVDRGFPAARIEAVGYGQRALQVQTTNRVDEPRNRRVTVEVR